MYKSSIYNNIIELENGGIIIYNSFTKARIKVDDKFYLDKMVSNINEKNEKSIFDEETKILLNNGFIVDCCLDEQYALKYVYNKRYFGGKELGLILMPTLKCNFSCPYCFEKPNLDKIKDESKEYFSIIEKYLSKVGDSYNIVNLSFLEENRF